MYITKYHLPLIADDEETYASRNRHNNHFTPAQNAPFLLSASQIENPLQVIDNFFQNRHLAEHRQTLWDILSAAITSDTANLYDSSRVGSWVIYFRSIEELIEAAWLLNNRPKLSYDPAAS